MSCIKNLSLGFFTRSEKNWLVVTEESKKLELSDLKRDWTIHEKSKAVTAQLIYVFGFAYAKSWFSHEVAHIMISLLR